MICKYTNLINLIVNENSLQSSYNRLTKKASWTHVIIFINHCLFVIYATISYALNLALYLCMICVRRPGPCRFATGGEDIISEAEYECVSLRWMAPNAFISPVSVNAKSDIATAAVRETILIGVSSV